MSDRPAARVLAAALVVGASVVLGGCGYQPLYGRHADTPQVERALQTVRIVNIPDRVGQMMRSALEHRFAPARGNAAYLYDFSVTLSEGVTLLAVDQSSFGTRANLRLNAQYTLTRRQDGATLAKGDASMVSSYNVLSSEFATLAAEEKARERAVEELASILRTRAALYFHGPGAALAGTVRR
ncbi:MAG: hypothetical protein HQL35_14590 [Alphaproteobacteria bacterium]|nr:hypothetical protein [Alphaproteobacteria bacterium]